MTAVEIEKELTEIGHKLQLGEELDPQEVKLTAKCLAAIVAFLKMDLDRLSALPWRRAGLDRFYPNRERHTWKEWTDDEVKYGIPQNAVLGDNDGYLVATVRGIASNYNKPEDMERNRDAIMNCVNAVYCLQTLFGVVDGTKPRVV